MNYTSLFIFNINKLKSLPVVKIASLDTIYPNKKRPPIMEVVLLNLIWLRFYQGFSSTDKNSIGYQLIRDLGLTTCAVFPLLKLLSCIHAMLIVK